MNFLDPFSSFSIQEAKDEAGYLYWSFKPGSLDRECADMDDDFKKLEQCISKNDAWGAAGLGLTIGARIATLTAKLPHIRGGPKPNAAWKFIYKEFQDHPNKQSKKIVRDGLDNCTKVTGEKFTEDQRHYFITHFSKKNTRFLTP